MVISALCVLFFFTGALLLSAYVWVAWKFSSVTLDIIIIQLTLSLKGVDKQYLYSGGTVVLLVVLLSIQYGRVLWRTFARERLFGLRAKAVRPLLQVFSVALLAGSFFLLEKRFEIIEFLFPGDPFSLYIEERYAMPGPAEFTFPDGKNNLVILFIESMEWTYSDPDIFSPSMTPRLRELAKRGIALYGQRQATGTGYSASGFRSLLFGLPGRPFVSVRNMVDMFFGRIRFEDLEAEDKGPKDYRDYTLVGILEQHGYAVSVFRGAEASFGGYGTLLEQATTNRKMFDAAYFLENSPSLHGEKQNGWGVNDSFLYDRGREYLAENGAKGPFATIFMSVNSHAPGNYEPGMPRPYGDYRDTLVQSDALVADFVEWLLKQPFADKTTIVVMGDHLLGESLMPSKAVMPPMDRRHIMVNFINPRVAAPPGVDRKIFATWDLTATVLEAAGARFPGRRFGMGTSVFSDAPTLFEKEGIGFYEKSIKKRSRFTEKRYGW